MKTELELIEAEIEYRRSTKVTNMTDEQLERRRVELLTH